MKKLLIFALYLGLTQTLLPATLVLRSIEKARQAQNQQALNQCFFKALGPLCQDKDIPKLFHAALEAGADLNAHHKDKPGFTLLHAAADRLNCYGNTVSTLALYILLRLGLDPNAADASYSVPLNLIDFKNSDNAQNKRIAVEIFIKAGTASTNLRRSTSSIYLNTRIKDLTEHESETQKTFIDTIAYVSNLNPGISKKWHIVPPEVPATWNIKVPNSDQPLRLTDWILQELYGRYMEGKKEALVAIFSAQTPMLKLKLTESFTPEFLKELSEKVNVHPKTPQTL
jgi:hypothetical protein